MLHVPMHLLRNTKVKVLPEFFASSAGAEMPDIYLDETHQIQYMCVGGAPPCLRVNFACSMAAVCMYAMYGVCLVLVFLCSVFDYRTHLQQLYKEVLSSACFPLLFIAILRIRLCCVL